MATDDAVKEQLRRYEIVEWWYDGLNGKIIPWTTEHGNTSDDPSVQAFVVKADGEVLARAPNGQVYQASSFARWIEEQADAYEKKYPATRVPFLRAEVVAGEDGGTDVRCPALDEAREAGRPVLVYFGREEREGQERKLRTEVKAARKLERSALDSKKAAEAAEGWTLLRFDLGDETHARLAAGLGVEKAPAFVLFAPGAAGELLKTRLTGASLAYLLKKHAPVESD